MSEFISYLRVSTQQQGHSGLGIEAQRAAVHAYIGRQGGSLLGEYVEIESGSRKARPILVQSIALCRRSKAILVIARLDRLARNVAFISSLMEGGVEFVAVDAPYANRFMIHILAAFAEHERSLISDRTKAALAAAKARGVRLGQNGNQLAQQNRSAAMAYSLGLNNAVLTAQGQGASTLFELASALNVAGHRTREGSLWSVGTAHRLLGRLARLAEQHKDAPP